MDLPDPASIARSLLEQASQRRPPVRLEAVLAVLPGVRVSTEELDGEGYLVDLGSLGAEILVRSDAPDFRRRYTIAHELGHWVLTKQSDHGNTVSTEYQRVAVEKWCDRFAAELLMPDYWVRQGLSGAKLRGLAKFVMYAPELYSVSHRAFRLRVSEVSDISIYELRQKPGHVVVDHRYEANSLGSEASVRTLRQVCSLVCESNVPSHFLHPESKLLSIHSLIQREGGSRHWLVFVLPAPDSIARLELRDERYARKASGREF